MDKGTLRRELATRREATPAEDREQAGLDAARRFAVLPEWRAARTVALYAPIRSEVPTRALFELAIREHRVPAFPKVADGSLTFHEVRALAELAPGAFGVPEPPAAAPRVAPDLLVVPGLAFDPEGGRLGYGRGFFDRALAGTTSFSVGLAYDFQVLARLPQDAHDVPVRAVVTEARVLRAPPAARGA